jgi:hypothetical protein
VASLSPVDHAVDVGMLPMALRLELAGLYFDYIHDQFHSLFHRPSFLQDVAEDCVPAIVLLAMFALSARYAQPPVCWDAAFLGPAQNVAKC